MYSPRRVDSLVRRRSEARRSMRRAGEIIDLVRPHRAGASASSSSRSSCALLAHGARPRMPSFARVRLPPASHTCPDASDQLTLGLAWRLCAVVARGLSVAQAGINILFEFRALAPHSGRDRWPEDFSDFKRCFVTDNPRRVVIGGSPDKTRPKASMGGRGRL